MQDEIQGYHWSKDQCTMYSVVIYSRRMVHIITSCCASFVMIWRVTPVLFMRCREQSCFTSRRIGSRSKVVTILVMAVLGSTRTIMPFWTFATTSQILTLIKHEHFLQQAMGNFPATPLAALSNSRYFVPVCRGLLRIKSWCSMQLKSTANHP